MRCNNSNLTQFKILKFASFNTRNSLTNLDFINFLLNMDLDVLFISETWLLNNESHYLKKLTNNYEFLHKSDMITKPKRPFGGNCIFYKKELFNCKSTFIDNHICLCEFNKHSILFLIIFVHLPYDDATSASLYKFDCRLSLIHDTCSVYLNKNYKIFITGDFNSDPNRNRRFDKFFINFLKKFNYTFSNNYLNDYSYSNGSYTAYLDHCIFPKNLNIIYNNSVLYENDIILNNSDHKPLISTIFYEGSEQKSSILNTSINLSLFPIYPNLNHEETKEKFQKKVEEYYDSITNEHNHSANDFEYYRITTSIKLAFNSLIQIVSKKKFVKLRKFWFNDELKNLKKKKLIYIKENKLDPNYKITITNFKKESRRIQRKNIKLMEAKKITFPWNN